MHARRCSHPPPPNHRSSQTACSHPSPVPPSPAFADRIETLLSRHDAHGSQFWITRRGRPSGPFGSHPAHPAHPVAPAIIGTKDVAADRRALLFGIVRALREVDSHRNKSLFPEFQPPACLSAAHMSLHVYTTPSDNEDAIVTMVALLSFKSTYPKHLLYLSTSSTSFPNSTHSPF